VEKAARTYIKLGAMYLGGGEARFYAGKDEKHGIYASCSALDWAAEG
jgi:hypothetical protein